MRLLHSALVTDFCLASRARKLHWMTSSSSNLAQPMNKTFITVAALALVVLAACGKKEDAALAVPVAPPVASAVAEAPGKSQTAAESAPPAADAVAAAMAAVAAATASASPASEAVAVK